MTHTNLKAKTEILLEARLEAIRSGEIRLVVHNQMDEVIIEQALENMGMFEAAVEQWQSEGVAIANVDPMTWAHELAAGGY